MPIDASIKEVHSGVSASNAVGRANPGMLSEHPGEYVFQMFVEIANNAGIGPDVENCFSDSGEPKPYSDAIAELDGDVTEKGVFMEYSNLYCAAIMKLLQTIESDEDDGIDFRCEMFNELHENVQFLRLCSFLVSLCDDNNIFEAELRDVYEWLFSGNELESSAPHNKESAEVYLVNGASPACDAYDVYLDGEPLYHLTDNWSMSSIESGSWAVCDKEKKARDNHDKLCVVIEITQGSHHGNEGTSDAQMEGTDAECKIWISANQAPRGSWYEIIDRYEIMKEQRILIPEKYHPSLILSRLDRIPHSVRSLYLSQVKIQLTNWMTFGPQTGPTLMMAGSGDSSPKTAPNPEEYYKDSGSKQFVCKLRPGRWSNELDTLTEAIGELPNGYDLAILLWSHSVNQDFTDLIHTLIKTKGDVKRIAGIVHYDNKGTYISEHSYTTKGWKFEEQNANHKGTIEGFNLKV